MKGQLFSQSVSLADSYVVVGMIYTQHAVVQAVKGGHAGCFCLLQIHVVLVGRTCDVKVEVSIGEGNSKTVREKNTLFCPNQ